MNDQQREAFSNEDIEAIITCLDEDAATLRDENPDDEIASNMQAAASLIEQLRAALTQPQAQQAAAVPAGLLEPHVVEAAALAYEMSPCHDLIGPMEDALRAAIASAPPAPVLPLSDGKWEVRVAGPDDVHTLDTEIDALRQANEVNKAFVADCLNNPDDYVLCVATVHDITDRAKGVAWPFPQVAGVASCEVEVLEGQVRPEEQQAKDGA